MDFSTSLLIFSLSSLIAVECSFLRKKLNIDREHVKLDFLNLFGFGSWSDILSDAEMDFRYFIAHDRDNNKKLDGLELFTALEHDAKHDTEAHGGEPSTAEDIEKEVEAIFEEHDKDGDGYLEYKEFMSVHKTHPDISGERKRNPKNPEL